MNNKMEQVFKLLNIKPYEKFLIKHNSTGTIHYECIYFIDRNLTINLYLMNGKVKESTFNIANILNGEYSIVKFFEYTDKEKQILKALHILNFNYIAKDDKKVYAYRNKPEKTIYDSYTADEVPLFISDTLFQHIDCENIEKILKTEE